MNEGFLNDVLTAECTLLTVISILTGLWYNDIVKAHEIEVKNTPGYYDQRKEIRLTLWWKTFPLMVLSFISTIVFVPNSYSTIMTITKWFNSPIAMSVVIVNVVLAIMFFIFMVFFFHFSYKLLKK